MTALEHFIFLGLPTQQTDSTSQRKHINLERAKIYFGNTIGSVTALGAGLLLAVALLTFFHVSKHLILSWASCLTLLGAGIFLYESYVQRIGLTYENMAHFVFTRLIIGFGIAITWGYLVLLLPNFSRLGYAFAYIAMSTFIHIGMLSFSVLPIQYLLYSVVALFFLEFTLITNYVYDADSFYILLGAVAFVCEGVLLKKAIINSKTAIQTIILNEQLKEEIQKYSDAQSRIEYLAYHDHLTGIWNRRYIETHLEKLEALGKRFGVLLVDINHFKRINDTYGHRCGDQLLINFTQNLLKNLQYHDFLGRYGGDEFIIIYQELHGYESFVSTAKALKEAMHQTYTIHDIEINSTASVGWAVFMDDTYDLDELLHLADERMYEDKKLDHAL